MNNFDGDDMYHVYGIDDGESLDSLKRRLSRHKYLLKECVESEMWNSAEHHTLAIEGLEERISKRIQ